MKKTKYKLIKGAMSFAMAVVMVASFSGCHKVKNSVYADQSNPVSLYDESGNPLIIIAFVSDSGAVKNGESYGYIQQSGDKFLFYDVLNEEHMIY